MILFIKYVCSVPLFLIWNESQVMYFRDLKLVAQFKAQEKLDFFWLVDPLLSKDWWPV